MEYRSGAHRTTSVPCISVSRKWHGGWRVPGPTFRSVPGDHIRELPRPTKDPVRREERNRRTDGFGSRSNRAHRLKPIGIDAGPLIARSG